MNRRSFLSIPLVGLIPEKALSIAPAVTAVDAGKVTEWVGLDLASKWDWDTGIAEVTNVPTDALLPFGGVKRIWVNGKLRFTNYET